MATATRRPVETHSADPTVLEIGEDGFPIRYEEVDGELVGFSLKPFPEAERPLYWNIYPNQEMRWRSREKNQFGWQPTIQKEVWLEGKFSPRNPWEEHMTRQWMRRVLPGCTNPDEWKGIDHPKKGVWRCHCSWACGNYTVFEQHQRSLSHTRGMRSENPPQAA